MVNEYIIQGFWMFIGAVFAFCSIFLIAMGMGLVIFLANKLKEK